MAKSALGIVRKYYPGVKRIVEAKKNAPVEVTPKDCAYSRKKSPDSCAMVISTSVAYLIKGDVATRFHVPQSVSRELVSFDRNHNFAPGTYELKAPSKFQKLSPRRYKLKEDRHKRKYRSSKVRHATASIRSL